jgi:hypothetical protein
MLAPRNIVFWIVLILPFHSVACTSNSVVNRSPVPDESDPGTTTNIHEDFATFSKSVSAHVEGDFVRIESNGLPKHHMLRGIEAANAYVPLPQQYDAENAWMITSKPRRDLNGVSTKDCFYRGVIAIAINGVPIVSALNEKGVHSFAPNELDEYGGHCGCGRGDEYHYHLAPTHLRSKMDQDKPIAYALDGYPIFGYHDSSGAEPSDLDQFHGRTENGGYRYYSSRWFPYVNAGMRGMVEIKDGQVVPQPNKWPVRCSENKSAGITINGFNFDENNSRYEVEYRGGQTYKKEYFLKDKDTVEFTTTSEFRFEKSTTELRRSDPSVLISANDQLKAVRLDRPSVILRIRDGYEGYVFFIKDSNATPLEPQYGRLVIKVPDSGVLHTPELKIIGDHYSIFAEYQDGSRIYTHSRKSWSLYDSENNIHHPTLEDGGSGTKQNALGKEVQWVGFYIGKAGRPGVLPDFPPGL